jgi:hypothetical protein
MQMLSEHFPVDSPRTAERLGCHELTEALRAEGVRYKLSLGPEVCTEIPVYMCCFSPVVLQRASRPQEFPKRPPRYRNYK